MVCEVVKEIENLLNDGEFNRSIVRMRSWLSTAQAGDPARLLDACSASVRPRITLLMRDLISRYPSTLIGCPILLYAIPEMELDSPSPPTMSLPYPRPDFAKPCADLHFIGWMPCDTELPISLPFKPADHPQDIPWHTPTAVVALFRTHPGLYDLESLELPPCWWGELFMSSTGNVRMEGSLLMAYPDALDVARSFSAGARGELNGVNGVFIRDTSWARDEGELFQENCRNQFRTEF